MSKLLLITEQESDLAQVLHHSAADKWVTVRPGKLDEAMIDTYSAIAILGGVSGRPLMLIPRERHWLEGQLAQGVKVFSEYCASIGPLFFTKTQSTRFERLTVSAEQGELGPLALGELIEDQDGMRMIPFPVGCSNARPLLYYVKQNVHDRAAVPDDHNAIPIEDRALWFEMDGQILVSSFRLANFNRARHAPIKRIRTVIRFIAEWLLGRPVALDWLEPPYRLGPADGVIHDSLHEQIRDSAERAVRWYTGAGLLLNEGRDGVMEGMASDINSDGRQRRFQWLRSDCIGEVSLSYYMHYLLDDKNPGKSLQISDRLMHVCFDYMQVKEEGLHHGMLRWTQEQWDVCYQDDVARAIIPQLLKCLYSNTTAYLEECEAALEFLLRTTGTDGTRELLTYNTQLTSEAVEEMANVPGAKPSAHFNAYYHAALLLAYRLTGKEVYRSVAAKGLETIMNAYPHTMRVMSQVQEMSRLILPLSWLYWVTGESRHLEWLYQVTEDMQPFKDTSTGAYVEWDEGYESMFRRKYGADENTLLTQNGDPVADLLYTNNWLPIGWIQAFLVTKDQRFWELWEETARFIVSAQIRSCNLDIDGGWARAYDVEKQEVYATPADDSWGPWAIESGWTVAEISSGLMMGLLLERLKPSY